MQNMKFRVNSPEHSEKIQKALFAMGVFWAGESEGNLQKTGAKFLFSDNRITYSYSDENLFISDYYPEYTLEQIVNISYEFKPTLIGPEYVTLNGKKYNKAELEKALQHIKPME